MTIGSTCLLISTLLYVIFSVFFIGILFFNTIETSRGAGAQSVTAKSTGCGFDPYSRKRNISLHLYFHFFALVAKQSAAQSSAIQHAMPVKFSGK